MLQKLSGIAAISAALRSPGSLPVLLDGIAAGLRRLNCGPLQTPLHNRV